MVPPLICKRRIEVEELIDRPDTSPEDIRATLRDQAMVNRVLGGGHATWAHALPMVRECGSDPVRVADLACGGGDVSRRIVDEARKMGRAISVVALDINVHALAQAREMSAGYPEMSFMVGDALNTPFADGAFDIVLLATFLHHLPPDGVVEALREAARISRGRVVAADLVRSSLARIGILLFARLVGFHPVSTHDGAVSVCKAYTPDELAELAARAGLRNWSIHQHSLYRMALVYDGSGVCTGLAEG